MELFFVTFFVMALAVLGMSVGVVFGRSPIAGSCGGLGAVDGSGRCQSCSRPCRTARRRNASDVAEQQSGRGGLPHGSDGHTTADSRTSTEQATVLKDFREQGIR